MGGYSSTLFHLLYRFSPEIRGEFGRSEEGRWIERYGFVEHTIGRDDPDSFEDGAHQQAQALPQGRAGAAGARPRRALPPHRQLGLPAALRRRRRAPALRGARAALLDGHRAGRQRALAALGLRRALRDAPGGARRRAVEGLAAVARHLPADAARLPRRLHAGRDGLRPGVGGAARAGAAPPRGPALPEGAGARRPRRRRAAGRAVACSSTSPTRVRATSRDGWRTCSPATASGSR